MAESLQCSAHSSSSPNNRSPPFKGQLSGDAPSSDLAALGLDASCSVTRQVASGPDAGASDQCDRSGADQSLRQSTPCSSLRPASPMTTTPPAPDPLDQSALVTDTIEGDCHPVSLPVVAGPSHSGLQQYHPRSIDPQPNASQSVPQANLEPSSSLSHVDKGCAALVTGPIHPPQSPSLVPSSEIANVHDTDLIPSVTGPVVTQPLIETLDTVNFPSNHPSGALANFDRSVDSSASAPVESSIGSKHAPTKDSVAPVVNPLSQSSPTPTTSTSQPSVHGNSDRGSEPPGVVLQPSQQPPVVVSQPLISSRPAHRDPATRPFDPQHHPVEPTSSVSSPLSPISKRPSSPIMAPDSVPPHSYDEAPSGQLRVNGNGSSLPIENGHKRQKMNEGLPLQNSSGLLLQDSSSGLPLQNSSSTPLPLNSTSAPSSVPLSTSSNAHHSNGYTAHSSVAAPVSTSGSQSGWLIPGTPGTNFTRKQHRFACSVLKELKKHRDASPFLRPVDVATYYDYPAIIKQPMDLSTVDNRLGKPSKPCYYTSAEQFIRDVQLIFTNCYTYNGTPDVAHVSHMALTLSLLFESQMKKLPAENPAPHFPSRSPSLAKTKVQTALPQAGSTVTSSAKRKVGSPVSGSPAASTSAPSGQKRRSSSPQHNRKKSTKTTAHSTPAGGLHYPEETRPVPSAAGSGYRNSAAVDLSAARLQNPPKHKQPVYESFIPENESTVKNKKNISTAPLMVSNAKEELKFCKELLREVNKKPHEKFAWPFYEPVDPVRLGIPEYFKMIKRPMDLSTMKSKLDRSEYKAGAAFAADFRLMLWNCFEFNPMGNPVYNLGKQLEAWFENKWLERPPELVAAPPPAASVSAPPPNNPTGEVDEIEKIKYDLEVLTERLARETARKEGSFSAGYAVGTGPPSKKASISKAASTARNLSNINVASSGPTAPAPASAQPNKPNGGSKAKATGSKARKKPTPAAGIQTSATGKRQAQPQQQLAQRHQVPSPFYQQQQAAAAVPISTSEYHTPLSQAPGLPDHFEKIDYEQKKELANLIQNAVEPMQSQAINLIRSAHPDLVTPDGEEIELDIDALDDRTLYRLYRLVCDAAPEAPPPPAASAFVPPSAPAKKKKPANVARKPSGAVNGSKPSNVKKKAPPRKTIDENHETEKIKRIEQQLHAFETPAVPVAGGIQSHAAVAPTPHVGTSTAQPPPGPEYASSSSESESESDDESD